MENWNERALTSVDYHTAGEPFRILDVGPMEGTTVLDRRSWAQENLDDLRQFLINGTTRPRRHVRRVRRTPQRHRGRPRRGVFFTKTDFPLPVATAPLPSLPGPSKPACFPPGKPK